MKKKICIYCGANATTRDHVPPRLLLGRPFPRNLSPVPSCLNCNQGASRDEEYFLALIAQTSPAPYLNAKLEEGGTLYRAFVHSPKFEQRFLNSLIVDEATGLPYLNLELDELRRVSRVVAKIALGLFNLKYGWTPKPESVRQANLYPYGFQDDRPTPYFIATFTERFQKKHWQTIQPSVFSYIFMRDPKHSGTILCIMRFHETFWGVVHLPHRQDRRALNKRQLRLFESEILY